MTPLVIRHFHLFCGLGGGARGFNQGHARVGSMQARFRCLGGIDVDPAIIRDFERLAGVPGTALDMFNREQYTAFHGRVPPQDWREATPQDIQAAAGHERPHIVFLSAPCKGFSGLLSEKKSTSAKYQALNGLTLRGVWLMLEAWQDDPPELVVFENVPRIQTRGRALLDQVTALLRSYGYAVAETAHDCGEIGGLAQTRKRFLLVARHVEKVPPFLYEPEKRPLRAVGDILGRMPMPGDPLAGPMHNLPALQWKTWVRLAFVEAGSDWRSLNKLRVRDGYLADYLIVPSQWHHGALGVRPWCEPSGAVTGGSGVTSGCFSVADPRVDVRKSCGGVLPWNGPSGTIQGESWPSNGRFAVADPRVPGKHEYGQYGVLPFDQHCGAVSGQSAPGGGRYSVADPRPMGQIFGKYAVTKYQDSTGTVISGSQSAQGAYAVADPRPRTWTDGRAHFNGGGHFGVQRWDAPSKAVVGKSIADRGPWSVADPRLPKPTESVVCCIEALDGTWHRPFTTLELAALQGLLDPEEDGFALDGASHSAWRERIGNAVPPPAAQAIAGVMGTTLLLAWSGETFSMGSTPIWVRPMVAALMAAHGGAG